jgi:ribonuclease HI
VSSIIPRNETSLKRSNASNDDVTEQPPTKKQQSTIFDQTIHINIMFDGGSRGNPGIAGAGATVTLSEQSKTKEEAVNAFRRVIHIRDYLGIGFTNNEAEYQGIVRGLMIAKTEALKYCPPPSKLQTNLIVQGDSNLIIQQLNGSYECKSPKLISRFNQVKALLTDFDKMGNCTKAIEHVYRKHNSVADGKNKVEC